MKGFPTNSQEPLFCFFNLEDQVPQNHHLSGIYQYLDLNELHRHLAERYSNTGRLSIDPELMICRLIIGYSFGIRSDHRLCEEVPLSLAYSWFCRLGLEDKVPDHSTSFKNRHGRFRDSGGIPSSVRNCIAMLQRLLRNELSVKFQALQIICVHSITDVDPLSSLFLINK